MCCEGAGESISPSLFGESTELLRVSSMLAVERENNVNRTAPPPNPEVLSTFKTAVENNLAVDVDGGDADADAVEERRLRLKTLFLMIAHERHLGMKRRPLSLDMAHALIMVWYSVFPDDVFALVDRLAEMDGATDLFAPPRISSGIGISDEEQDNSNNLVRSYFRSEDLFNGHPLLLKLLSGGVGSHREWDPKHEIIDDDDRVYDDDGSAAESEMRLVWRALALRRRLASSHNHHHADDDESIVETEEDLDAEWAAQIEMAVATERWSPKLTNTVVVLDRIPCCPVAGSAAATVVQCAAICLALRVARVSCIMDRRRVFFGSKHGMPMRSVTFDAAAESGFCGMVWRLWREIAEDVDEEEGDEEEKYALVDIVEAVEEMAEADMRLRLLVLAGEDLRARGKLEMLHHHWMQQRSSSREPIVYYWDLAATSTSLLSCGCESRAKSATTLCGTGITEEAWGVGGRALDAFCRTGEIHPAHDNSALMQLWRVTHGDPRWANLRELFDQRHHPTNTDGGPTA